MKPARSFAGSLRGKSGALRLALWRCGVFWRKSVNAWRLTVDWTVVLYLVLPALWVVGGMYTELLQHPPAWISRVPEFAPAAILAVLMVRARLRTFAEHGDGLFLRSSGRWVKGMTAAGLAYTMTARLAVAGAATALMLPPLSATTGWGFGQGAVLAVSAGLMGFVWTCVRDATERRWLGVRRVLAVNALRVVFFAAWVPAARWLVRWDEPAATVVIIAALAMCCVMMGRRRTRTTGTFAHELEAERQAYADNVGWVLMDTEKAPTPPAGRRPWVLRNPRPLLKRRSEPARIAELWLRSLLRDAAQMTTLLRFAWLGVAALWLPPLWLAAIAWIGMIALLVLWLDGLWGRWLIARYMALFDWHQEIRSDAGDVGRLLLLRPFGMAWCAVIGLHAGWMLGGLWWSAAALLPAVGYPLLGWINAAASKALAVRAARTSRTDSRPSRTDGKATT